MEQQTTDDIFGLGGAASEAIDTELESRWLRENFKLPYNPFPPSGISPHAPEGPPLKDEQGREIGPLIGHFIMSAYRHPASTQGLVVVGAYGTGKTHLLRLMHNQINEWLGSGEQKALSIYVQRPRAEAQDLNREVLRSLGEDTVRKMLWFCMRQEMAEDIESDEQALRSLRRHLEGPLFDVKTDDPPEDRVSQLLQSANLDDHRTFFESYDAQGWPRELLHDYFVDLFARSLRTDCPLEVMEAFVALLLAPDEKSRATWESLLALGKQRKPLLLAAPEFLKDLLNLVRINGYVYTFLLIDEFEEVPGGYLLTRRQKADYMYTLMEMLNKLRQGFGLVLAITPEAWEILTAEAYPLRDRLPTVIRVGPLDAESISRLIEFYLRRGRDDGGLGAPSSLFPFSEAIIDEIASTLPARTPRNVLQFAHQIISYCVVHRSAEITHDTIETVMAEFVEMKTVEPQRRRLERR